MGMAAAQATRELGEIVSLLVLILARLGRRPAVHQGLLAAFAVFRGSMFVVYATGWGF